MLLSAAELSDDALVAQVKALATRERQTTAELIAALAELDARRLYLRAGCSSLFTYCTRVLHLSEHAAYGRIEAARVARRYPSVLTHLSDGSLTLTTVCLLGPVLTDQNHDRLFATVRHRSKREVELLVASERPQSAIAASVRKLPERRPIEKPRAEGRVGDRPGEVDGAPVKPAPNASPQDVPVLPAVRSFVVKPLAPERYKVQFTITRETHEKLQRVQDLLRHTNSTGDLALVFDRALTLLLGDLERRKLSASSRPRPARPARSRTRHIPAAVRREVWARDGGRCTFVGSEGQCGERGLLQFHHVVPYADGGAATAGNIQLRCAAHNRYEAALWSGTGQPQTVRERAPVFQPARAKPYFGATPVRSYSGNSRPAGRPSPFPVWREEMDLTSPARRERTCWPT